MLHLTKNLDESAVYQKTHLNVNPGDSGSTTYQEEGSVTTQPNLTGMTHKGIASHTSRDFSPTDNPSPTQEE